MRQTSDQEEALIALVEALESARIDYMVTGSIAASLYGIPRMTRDIDVVIDADASAGQRLLGALQPAFVVDQDLLVASLRERRMFNVFREPAIVKIDLIPRDRARDDDTVFARRIEVEVAGHRVRVTSAEDLIVAKLWRASSSKPEMQLRDVHAALGVPHLDREYLARRAARLGVSELLEEAKDARYDSRGDGCVPRAHPRAPAGTTAAHGVRHAHGGPQPDARRDPRPPAGRDRRRDRAGDPPALLRQSA